VSRLTGALRQLLESYRYAYPSARAKALRSLLLPEQNMQSLAEAADLEDALRLLRDTLYAEPLVGKKDMLEVEVALRSHLAASLNRVCGFLPSRARSIFTAYLQRYEAENIASLLLGVHHRMKGRELLQRIVPIHVEVEKGVYEKIANSKTLEEAVGALAGTCYHPALTEALKRFAGTGNVLVFHSALDRLVYERIFKAIESSGGGDVEALRRMIGIEVDIKNIKSILRLRDAHVPGEEVSSYLIPYGYKITAEAAAEISRSVDIEEIIARLERTFYHEPLERAHKEFEKTLRERRLILLENALDKFLERELKAFERSFPLSIGPVLGYVAAKTREVRRLIAILKLKDAGLSGEEIQEVLERI